MNDFINMDNIKFNNIIPQLKCNQHNKMYFEVSGCEDCENQKIIITDNKIKNNYLEFLLKESKVPTRYLGANFENFITNNQILENFLNNIKFLNQSALIIGSIGAGKTHLSISYLRQFLINNVINNFIIDDTIRNNYKFNVLNFKNYNIAFYIRYYDLNQIQIENKELFNNILKCKLLIIDEFGRSDSDYKNNVFSNLIDYRYSECLNTILISNLSKQDIISMTQTHIMSRIISTFKLITIEAQDFRKIC